MTEEESCTIIFETSTSRVKGTVVRMLEKHELPMCVLDVLRHDVIEDMHGILNLINNDGCIGWREFWPHDFTEAEVLEALRELDAEGFVQTLRESEKHGGGFVALARQSAELRDNAPGLWFHLTPAGRRRWETWNPPVSEADAETNEA
jgi:hypothetical protein